MNTVSAAAASMLPRQPMIWESIMSGQVASSIPPVPRESSSPVPSACSRGGNQYRMTRSAGTKTMAMPAPISMRPSAAMPTECAPAKMSAPAAPSSRKRQMVLRGPQRSDRMPAGICMKA